jgi:deoxyribodipyrimidine photo-lyase
MRYKRGLVWLRQDLRIDDNTALFEASHDCKELVVIFVFDPHILNNLPENDKRLEFLLATLRHLGKQIRELGGRLSILYGNPIEVVPSFAKQESIDAIYTNRSYGQYGQQRDQQLQDRAHDYGAARLDFKDYLLVEPEEVKTMRVYTPYYRRRQAFLDEHEQQDYKLLQIERLQSWAIEPTHRNKVESKLSFAPCPLWRPE